MEDSLFAWLKYYEALPGWLKNPLGAVYAGLPPELRHGGFYREYRRRIEAFERAENDAAARVLQQRLLLDTVNRAIGEIPFYRRFQPISNIEGFRRLPIVSKADYLKDRDAFCSEDRRRRMTANTGGSSGTPLTFFIEKGRTRAKEKSHFDWFWRQWGYREGEPMLMLRGKSLRNNALFEYQNIKHCLNVSCYELNDSNVGTVLHEIERFQPHYIHAYPSALSVFMRCVGEGVRKYLPELKTIFLGSEFLTRCDKEAFEAFFSAQVCSWYGHSECALHGGMLPGSATLTFFPFYGYFELIDDNGEVLTEPGASGRIVGTSFDNTVMPFIRYDTGDRGTLGKATKWNHLSIPALEYVDGRGQDVIYLTDGTAVSLTAFIFGQHLSEFDLIREMQLEQSEPGKLTLRLVPLHQLSQADCRRISEFLTASVSGKLDISIELAAHIEKTLRGKHRFLIQHYNP